MQLCLYVFSMIINKGPSLYDLFIVENGNLLLWFRHPFTQQCRFEGLKVQLFETGFQSVIF